MVGRIEIVNRRELLLSAGAGLALSSLLARAPFAFGAETADGEGRHSIAYSLYYRRIIGEAEPIEGMVVLELPEIAENGNTVQFKIMVDSPMTEADHIKVVHLMSTANPQPAVAAFHFTPLSGKAGVTGRMRLARTQDVVALAERSDGKFLLAVTNVKVTIGGCGN